MKEENIQIETGKENRIMRSQFLLSSICINRAKANTGELHVARTLENIMTHNSGKNLR